MTNHYEVLGAKSSDSQKRIYSKFRKVANEYHPQKEHGTTNDFLNIFASYEVLRTPETKKYYDITKLKSNNYKKPSEDLQKHYDKIKELEQKGRNRGEEYSTNFNAFRKRIIWCGVKDLIVDLSLVLIIQEINNVGILLGLAFIISGGIISGNSSFGGIETYFSIAFIIIGSIIVRRQIMNYGMTLK
jgi:hypothetical protein